MTLTDKHIKDLVEYPSLGAVAYQAKHLIESLRKIDGPEFPSEAVRIRDVLLAVAEHYAQLLDDLYDPDDPFLPRGTDDGVDRTGMIAQNLHSLYSFLRYLRATSSSRTPAEFQKAIAGLARHHFPAAKGEPICVVRPQWHYNLSYVPIISDLAELLGHSILDPEKTSDDLDAHVDESFEGIWKRWRENELKRVPERQNEVPADLPRHIGILSFAGLDTPDILFFPLLAHELGHFLSSSLGDPDVYLDEQLRSAITIDPQYVQEYVVETEETAGPIEVTKYLEERRDSCTREFLADFIGLRIMGLSFFLAQAEFLKTISGITQPAILEEGYPGIRFRLAELFAYMESESDDGGETILHFLENASNATGTRKEVGELLLRYLAEWKKQLAVKIATTPHKSQFLEKAQKVIEEKVRLGLHATRLAAERIVPHDRRAVLSDNFFTRIDLLKERRPPMLDGDGDCNLAEICSAGWAFQIVYGELLEARESTLDARRYVYNETCGLVREAIQSVTDLRRPEKSEGEKRPVSHEMLIAAL